MNIRYKTQFRAYTRWCLMRLRGRYDHPKPALFYPTDGWIANPEEIVRAIRLDDNLSIKPKGRAYAHKDTD